jgi:hypothetical protein
MCEQNAAPDFFEIFYLADLKGGFLRSGRKGRGFYPLLRSRQRREADCMSTGIAIKRVYDAPQKADGFRRAA